MEKEQKLFFDKSYLSFNPKIEIYNLCPLGSGFKRELTLRKLKILTAGKGIAQHTSTSISVFAFTPDKEKNLIISLHDGYRTSKSALMTTQMDAIVESFKIA